MAELKLYRSVLPKNNGKEEFIEYRDTMRPPRNVPYLVDNLWEWLRPEEYPCRRFSAYASPSPELARKSGQKEGVVFEIEFLGELRIAQVRGYTDSKYHPETKKILNEVIGLLNKATGGGWPNFKLERKFNAGKLWVPCLTKKEINGLFENVSELGIIETELRSIIGYWKDVELLDMEKLYLPDENGEIFFEAKGGYWLKPIA